MIMLYAAQFRVELVKNISGLSLAGIQNISGVACHETGFGMYWKNAMVGSWNQGAMQCGVKADANGRCPPSCATYGDSHANGQKYLGCFKRYPSFAAGVADFAHWFLSRHDTIDAAQSGDCGIFVTSMHDHGYFEGNGPTVESRVEAYDQAVLRCASLIAAAFGEPLEVSAHDPAWIPPIPIVDDNGEPNV